MKSVTAKDAKQGFGELMDSAAREPVAITKNGKPATVMISHRDYERFEALEDLVWALRAEAVLAQNEFLGSEETARFIKEALARADA